MIQLHANAFLALLQPGGGPPVHDGKVPQGAVTPYLLVYFDDGDPEEADSRPLKGASERHVTRCIVHGVGVTGSSARAMQQFARTQLLDIVPTVTGRRCLPIRREDGQPTIRDETTGASFFDSVSTYRLESVPA
jgi:hypothetical protein